MRMAKVSSQGELFGHEAAMPEGWDYRREFLTGDEEAALVGIIAALPLTPARYRAYVARRRIVSYGAAYDFTTQRLAPADPLPDFLLPLRRRAGEWLAMDASAFEHALITEYSPGTPIGWHRDVPDFEVVVGISLAGQCRMRLRPYPHVPRSGEPTLETTLAPRSAYVLRGPARWRWQHQIPPTAEQRYSITLRTRRSGRARRQI